eukprot:GHVQ01011120.1.p1 GENE.GHVQ01011120.1~~GHVQ01011120.1.p1  ORF type:complete len:362 (-),score=15.64 GHVQ01011120.1:1070-2155(-)
MFNDYGKILESIFPTCSPSQDKKRRWVLLNWFIKAFFIAIFCCWTVRTGLPLIGLCNLYLTGYPEDMMLTSTMVQFNECEIRSIQILDENKLTVPQAVQQIPAIIHRTWKTSDLSTVPSVSWAVAHERCELLHPGWKVMLWTDESARSFIAKHYAWFLRTYDSYAYPIQRVDAMRYFLLYHYGGVYMDMDIECRRNLTPLINAATLGRAILPITWPLGLSNDLMLAPARHPFMRRLLEALPATDKWHGSNYLTVFFSTGPAFVSLLHNRHKEKNEVELLDLSMYGHDEQTGFFYHRPGSSWHGKDVAAIKMIMSYNSMWIPVWCLCLCVMLLVRRRWRKQSRATIMLLEQSDIGASFTDWS